MHRLHYDLVMRDQVRGIAKCCPNILACETWIRHNQLSFAHSFAEVFNHQLNGYARATNDRLAEHDGWIDFDSFRHKRYFILLAVHKITAHHYNHPSPPQAKIPALNKQGQNLARYAWLVLGINVAVVLWGAYVRASGSGAGCGDHWPLCNGQVLPQAPQVATVIELAHRGSSGIALIMVLVLAAGAWRKFARGHRVRAAAMLSVASILVESLLGAVIVLANFTGSNTSGMRALVVALHLVNTLFLLGALALTAGWAGGGGAWRWKDHPASAALFVGGAIGFALLASSGAITALGDTLFPSASLAQGLQQDLSLTVNLLVRLRVLHPLFAVFMGTFAVSMALLLYRRARNPLTQRLAWLHTALFGLQCVLGMLNLVLLAPVPLQILHLLLADCVWVVYVLLASCALAQPAQAFRARAAEGSNPVRA